MSRSRSRSASKDAQLGQRALRDDAAMIDDGQPIAQSLGFLHVVRGVERRTRRACLVANQFQQANAALRIHADGGFIQQQHLGLMDNAARKIQAPLHSAAESFDRFFGAVEKPSELQHFA